MAEYRVGYGWEESLCDMHVRSADACGVDLEDYVNSLLFGVGHLVEGELVPAAPSHSFHRIAP